MTTLDDRTTSRADGAEGSGPTVADVSDPSRLAAPDEAISAEELQLAARNHGIPLEALRYDVTPAGLHYLLIHYDIPEVDAATHALTVGGAVDRPLTVSLADLRERPRVTRQVTLECAGNGRALLHPRPVSQPWLVEAVGNAEWTGTPLAPLLREAGLGPDAVDVVFTGADHGVERGVEQDYQRALPVADALREEVLLAYEMNGAPLLPQHGAPLRLIVPGWYGMAHVKWLHSIDVRTEPFEGYQNAVAYRVRQDADDPGVPVTRIEPRALVRPPGFPDFMSRRRVLRPGRCTVDGRAWSGHAPVVSVEVTTDGGESWAPAELDPPASGDFAWRRWRYEWSATPGHYVLGARATDASGRTQPVEQPWNRGGFANNLVQRVEVVVPAE
ncbi:sulfite oxidase [Micromonospora sp. WMMD967]|uniref:sulfite oxidase n=1 Tax=Micromonospora sp. WMMD967 TaxID=3016101 RepID=UPI002415D423|nr:sulfite oxidase [Micromonospora sp. WMMD967]MDG4837270.1 sulfite oxidase [Micromonospora sp. WMMD967]